MSVGPAMRHVLVEGERIATMVGAPAPSVAGQQNGELVFSRFAWLRREGDQFVVESALSEAVLEFTDTRVSALVLAFAKPRAVEAGLAAEVGLPLSAIEEVAAMLGEASILLSAAAAAEENLPPIAVWEFHDLLFHSRTRGRSQAPAGGTYRFIDSFAPTPGIPAPFDGDRVLLTPPDFDQLERDDPPLARAQSLRRSIRRYGERPLELAQLSEFLYRVGRIEEMWEMPIPGPAPNSISLMAKPYPSGGSLYELELYPVIASCNGIDAGIYHYEAERHALARVSEAGPDVESLLTRGAAAMGVPAGTLQVLLVITARFERLAWKYQSIAYELVLKHVGVLLQTMYLAATAMRLAPCAIGTGDSDLFARASGIPYYAQPSVGELALGSRPEG